MGRGAIAVLAGTGALSGLGRVVNGLETAKEFADTEGDEVELIFDGGGTQWIPKLEDEGHDYHALYDAVRDEVAVCSYCADAYGVEETVEDVGLEQIDEYEGHPSIRDLVDDGYEVITF